MTVQSLNLVKARIVDDRKLGFINCYTVSSMLDLFATVNVELMSSACFRDYFGMLSQGNQLGFL